MHRVRRPKAAFPARISSGEVDLEERTFLDAAAKALEVDLRATFSDALRLAIVIDEINGELFPRVVVKSPPELSHVLSLQEEPSEKDTVVRLAEAIQNSDIFLTSFDPWPRCPLHPNGQESLAPMRSSDLSWWVCPSTRSRIARIGDLRTAYPDGP